MKSSRLVRTIWQHGSIQIMQLCRCRITRNSWVRGVHEASRSIVNSLRSLRINRCTIHMKRNWWIISFTLPLRRIRVQLLKRILSIRIISHLIAQHVKRRIKVCWSQEFQLLWTILFLDLSISICKVLARMTRCSFRKWICSLRICVIDSTQRST